ncbi:MAG TPA: helix-hairpin-helix domain-containing protein [Bryobacteraceae bacterium]|nr:helix-hairpin-helix domain-containing protein [Bryobacteraceae bacterium]
MLSVSRLNIKAGVIAAFLTGGAWAQLPDGPGKTETEKLCSQCHELARSISLHQDRAGWDATVAKMVNLGAKASETEIQAVTEYLTAHFPAEEIPRINVNKARAIEFESGLSLRRSQAAAIIEYRTRNGPFKSIEDLKKVPGIDVAKIEAKKDRLIFEEKP